MSHDACMSTEKRLTKIVRRLVVVELVIRRLVAAAHHVQQVLAVVHDERVCGVSQGSHGSTHVVCIARLRHRHVCPGPGRELQVRLGGPGSVLQLCMMRNPPMQPTTTRVAVLTCMHGVACGKGSRTERCPEHLLDLLHRGGRACKSRAASVQGVVSHWPARPLSESTPPRPLSVTTWDGGGRCACPQRGACRKNADV